MAVLINFLLFQLAWFACVLGAANAMPWLGPVVVAAVVGVHLGRAGDVRLEAALLLFAAALGGVFDSLVVGTGWVAYPSGQWLPWLAPYWIVALWVGFATTFNVSLNWLKGRVLLAMVFGSGGGPLAYYAGSRLGGIAFVEPLPAMLVVGIGWGLLMPLLMAVATRLDGWRPGVGRRPLALGATRQQHV